MAKWLQALFGRSANPASGSDPTRAWIADAERLGLTIHDKALAFHGKNTDLHLPSGSPGDFVDFSVPW